jgi:hypothetical protein
MRQLARLLCMTIVIPAAACAVSGCITYPAEPNAFDGGEVSTLDQEMRDLKLALDRGAITDEEYRRGEAMLRDEFKNGKATAVITKTLNREEAEKYMETSHTTARKPLIHSVDGARPVHTIR